MMTVPGGADNIGGLTTGLKDSGDDVDGGQDLESPVNRSPSQRRVGSPDVRDELFGGERPAVPQNRINHRLAGCGRAVAVARERLDHLLHGWIFWRTDT